MYVFVIEPKGRFFEKVSRKYEVYFDGGIYFPLRPYFLYRVNESYSMQDLETVEILVGRDDFTKPPLFRYCNGDNTYSEIVVSESVAILRNVSYPSSLCLQNTNIPIGSVLAFFFFLALEDSSNGRIVRKTVWNTEEMEDMKEIAFAFLMEKLYQRQEKAKKN